MKKKPSSRPNHQSQLLPFSIISGDDDDDDFQIPSSQIKPKPFCSQPPPLKPTNCSQRASKKRKLSVSAGKENTQPTTTFCQKIRSCVPSECKLADSRLGYDYRAEESESMAVQTKKGPNLCSAESSVVSGNAVRDIFLGESSNGAEMNESADLSIPSASTAPIGFWEDESETVSISGEGSKPGKEDRLNSVLLSVDLGSAAGDKFLNENGNGNSVECSEEQEFDWNENCSLDLIKSSIDCSDTEREWPLNEGADEGGVCFESDDCKKGLKPYGGFMCNSIESRLLRSRADCGVDVGSGGYNKDSMFDEFEVGTQLDALIKLCTEVGQEDGSSGVDFQPQEVEGLDASDGLVCCPLCGVDISDLSDEERQVHTNDCLDEEENQAQDAILPDGKEDTQCPQKVINVSTDQSHQQVVDVSPVVQWLRSLDLYRYEEAFVREEVDWDALQWLTEEDLFSIGVTALGPRKKILHALTELKKERTHAAEIHTAGHAPTEQRKRTTNSIEIINDTSKVIEETSKSTANKLITDFFPGPISGRKQVSTTSRGQHRAEKRHPNSSNKHITEKNHIKNGKLRDVPSWCCIPGTPFRVDAFRFLRRDCSHWFLTHFHMDHYQGLTRSFCHGKIYCSSITAKLVNSKIGIPWDKLEVLPVNQKISISGIDVTCLDANHCPGSIIILFEPPNGKAVLHTGDFRFNEEMANLSVLQMGHIHTLILDTTYCNPQYDFPKQDAVIQFVIEAIQAETFNPKTLFLIGSYTIGKERLFLEVARVLRKKVHVPAAKLRILKCLGFSEEDMQWFTLNEHESHIHVVPMWTLASFKRLKHISNQYASRFSLIVAFSPTGWTFGKGKKKSPGRRFQQGTIIRYEVPYSEHCSFEELKEFVKLVSPENIIPSVNNDGPESTNAMLSLLSS